MALYKMINLLSKTHDFIEMINLLSKTNDFIKHDEFANKKWKGVMSEKIKAKPALLTRTCPPGLALASPDMSKVRVLVKFDMFRIQN